MKLTGCEDGDLRDGSEFLFTGKPTNMAQGTFVAITKDCVFVTRRFSNIANLPSQTKVIAHWHGKYRTEGFSSTVGKLKAKLAKNGYTFPKPAARSHGVGTQEEVAV